MLAGMDDNGVITVRDLRRRYGGTGDRGFDAVRGVTFSVRRGELFALLGTNGAGKTSTMEVLEGLAPPAGGAVRVLGCDPCRERALVRRRMGIMLQEGGFPSDLTVAETGRMWAGTLSAPRPVAEALGLVSLGHRAGVAVRSLSGGERRRLDLAMAILGRPEVLFLEAPPPRAGPGGPPPHVAADPRAAGGGNHGRAHHPLPGRGRGAGGPPGDHASGPERATGHAR